MWQTNIQNTKKIKKPKLHLTMNPTVKRLAIEKANSNCQSLSAVIERLVAQRYLGLTDYK
jgi:hypothetical protein